eukprot:gene6999-51199_t
MCGRALLLAAVLCGPPRGCGGADVAVLDAAEARLPSPSLRVAKRVGWARHGGQPLSRAPSAEVAE